MQLLPAPSQFPDHLPPRTRASIRSSSKTPKKLANDFDEQSFVGPYFREFGTSTLTYTARLLPNNPEKTLFEAVCTETNQKSKRVVVKFTRHYSKDAHEHLQKLTPPLAPKLLHCEKIKTLGDWWAVVMEYIEEQPVTKANKEQVKADVEKAINELHGIDFVHGDLRDVNVLVCASGAMLVDFDWTERVGVAKYPVLLNDEIAWPNGAIGGGDITKEHDEDMLQKLKDWVDGEA